MALIFPGKTTCPICNEVLSDGEPIVATSHFIADNQDPLWPFSDAGMHKSCFLEWEHKREFVRRYNAIIGQITWGNGAYHHMQNDGTILSLMRPEGRTDVE